MKKILIYFLFIFISPIFAAAEPVDLDKIISYLNSIRTLGADFRQVNNDGSASVGSLYIKKPGKFRMTYAPPDTSVVIVRDDYVTIFDKKNNSSYQKLSIEKSPFRILLSSELELDMDYMTIDFDSDNVRTKIIVSDTNTNNQGTLEIIFNNKPLALKKWLLTNSLNEKITVNLTNLFVPDALQDSLFDPNIEFNKNTNKP